MKNVLKNDKKFYVLRGPIPEQPPLTHRSDHDAWWKHRCDADDVSDIIMGTVILDLHKDLDKLEAYQMFRQVREIFQRYIKICFKPIHTLETGKVEESHNVCSKRPNVQNREITKKRHKSKKPKRKPKDRPFFYCGEIGHWKRN